MKFLNQYYFRFVLLFIFYALLICLLSLLPLSPGQFLLAAALATLLVLVVSFFFLRTLIRPLEQMSRKLPFILQGRYGEVKFSLRDDPFRETYAQLEEIALRMQQNAEKISRNKTGFYTIIESIQEAIWIQNKQGIITLCNEAFQELVEQYEVKDSYFWNVIRDQALYDFADKQFQKPHNLIQELQSGGNHYLISSSYSQLTDEVIFILHDITEIKNLQILKKDFVLNVSHELRTPLTSIKGFLETLDQEIPTEQKHYVEVIRRNTDRLINIVNDLLTLSKLEHDTSLVIEKIELSNFCQNLEKIFAFRLQEKQLQLNFHIKKRLKSIPGDRFKLEQVFINLIDNAVKYTEQGSIDVIFSQVQEEIIIEFRDTGMGIDSQHLPRIFERFYVVNKSRSRKYGSTGLGLAIVKHIVNLHGGWVKVESEPGSGTTFTLGLPLNQNNHEQ